METEKSKAPKEPVKKQQLAVPTAVLFTLLGLALAVIVYVNPLAKVASLFAKPSEVQPQFSSLGAEYMALGCPEHRFKSVRLLSRRPELIFIEGFLTEAEAQVLLNLA
jgi:hypothetical protein